MADDIKKKLADVAGQALEPPAKEIGNELAALLNILFTPIQMAKICHDAWLSDYKEKILKKHEKIPIEQRIAPPLNIIGPAIEASRFYLAEEKMREMFATLVASACDQQLEPSVHPAFASILTQMTPLEATILQSFRPKTEMRTGISIAEVGQPEKEVELSGTGIYTFPERYIPTVNYHLMRSSQRRTIYSNIIICPSCDDGKKISAAMSNLLRMGLIEITYFYSLDDEQYQCFLESQIYSELANYVEKPQPGQGVSISFIRGNMVPHGTFDKIVMDKGFTNLTQFGFDFTKTCILGHELVMEIGQEEETE